MDENHDKKYTQEGLPVVKLDDANAFLDEVTRNVSMQSGLEKQVEKWAEELNNENIGVAVYLESVSSQFPRKYQERIIFFMTGLYNLLKSKAGNLNVEKLFNLSEHEQKPYKP